MNARREGAGSSQDRPYISVLQNWGPEPETQAGSGPEGNSKARIWIILNLRYLHNDLPLTGRCLGSNIKSIALFLNMASIFIPHFTESLSVAARYRQHARSHSHSDASCQTGRSLGSPAASEHKMQFLCHKPSVQAAGPEAKTTGCLLVSRLFLENKLGSADCRQPPWPLSRVSPLGAVRCPYYHSPRWGPAATSPATGTQSCRSLAEFRRGLGPSPVTAQPAYLARPPCISAA